MNFRSVILKNIIASIRYYLAYFLCICFSIAFFFMLVNLVCDYNLKTAFGQSELFTTIVSIPLGVLGVFSMIFISYVNRTLIKQISKEMGLFLALGMERKKISTIVMVQNSTVGAAATAVGLLLGTVFSKLFFIIILEILDISDIPFQLHINSYIYTLLMFFIIYLYLLLRSLTIAKKLQANELLKESRKKENIGFQSPIWGIVGVILMLSSYLIFKKYVYVEKLAFIVFLGYTVITFAGLNLLLSQLHNVTSFLGKRNKDIWYKNLIFNTNLRHKINSNKKFIFALSITYYVVFLFGIMSYHEYIRVENVSRQKNPYDFVYMDFGENKITKTSLDEIIKDENVTITKEDSIQFIEMSMDNNPVFFIQDDNYNEIFSKDIKVSRGNCILLRSNTAANSDEKMIQAKAIVNYSEDFSKNTLGNGYSFNIEDIQERPQISSHSYMSLIQDICIISKEDFYEISNEINSQSNETMYLYNLKNWKDGYRIESSLNEIQESNFAFSTFGEVKRLKSQHGLLFFLFSYICFIFFLSAGSLIYFKYFSEIDYEKKIYRKLKCIGITNKEIKNMIGKDMLLIFFSPCMAGGLLSSLQYFELYPDYQRADLTTASLSFIAICVIFQVIYYFITRRKVYMEALK